MATLRKPALFLMFVLLATPAHATQSTYGDEPVLWEFVDQVNHYAAIQRMVIASLGPPLVSLDAEQVIRQQRRFANAMREMRPGACDGGFFTPAVSRYFRTRIDQIVRETGLDVTTTVEPPDDGEIAIAVVPRVAEAVPWSAGPVMWPAMAAGLPELPPELEYRFLGRHLVLIDVLANLVVDVLYDALPEPDVSSS